MTVKPTKPTYKMSIMLECDHWFEQKTFTMDAYDIGEYCYCKRCNDQVRVVETHTERNRDKD